MPDHQQHYETIARAIRYLQDHQKAHPSLEQLSQHLNLSPFHTQRLFAQWAGMTPKRFMQVLTKAHAKKWLTQSRSVLDGALSARLSSPERLHDRMVCCEAMPPREIKQQGKGLKIQYGFAETPLGRMIAASTERGICHLHFIQTGEEVKAERYLHQEWPLAHLSRSDAHIQPLAQHLTQLTPPTQPLNLVLKGTNFQVKIWETLLTIPAGTVASYGDLARLAGQQKASRAAGSAIARNQIAVLIPCHRVIRESGKFGQYRWGQERKKALLALESCEQWQTGNPDSP
ncbi:MAG: methylated-DNA--[protein]-cysteine S-methyltransferase [Endozoicomonas sp.]